ncbi:MAG TPA: cytochrome c family protein [Syntrophorhabdaceae bacterium]
MHTYRSLTGRARCACTAVFLILLLIPAVPSVAAEGEGYTGWKACAGCHDGIAGTWQTSRHGKAFDSLRKTKQENLPKCVVCHVTGYDRPGGFIDEELTPELSAVQCEACHGPGAAHAAEGGKAKIRKSPPVEVCRQCHTPGQDPNFDYSKKIRGIHEAGIKLKGAKK